MCEPADPKTCSRSLPASPPLGLRSDRRHTVGRQEAFRDGRLGPSRRASGALCISKPPLPRRQAGAPHSATRRSRLGESPVVGAYLTAPTGTDTLAPPVSKRAPQTIAPLLEAQEFELTSKLAQARSRYAQSGDRGDAAEIAIRAFLAENLSSRLSIGQGEIIDADGGRSQQCDVVIATDDHPFRNPSSEPGLFLVEGVFAAGEVKAQLTTKELDDAIDKGGSLKQLRKGHVGGAMVFSNPSDHERWIVGPPPFFVFAFESVVATTTLITRLAAAGDDVDALFVLGKGAAINFGDGKGFRRLRLESDEDATGWIWVEGNPSLLEFLGWLHALPRVDHQGSMFLSYLQKAADEGDGSLLAFPQPATPQHDEDQ